MTIDFHAEKNKMTYASRQADKNWGQFIRTLMQPEGKRVIDIGCGGGIYCKAWLELGVAEVIGVDFSERMLADAAQNCKGLTKINFQLGTAFETGLSDQCGDIVFERALIHHIDDLQACLAEAKRLLKPGGMVIIQDRTPEDVHLPGSPEHIRGYFFEVFPRLLKVESSRRPSSIHVREELTKAGFSTVKESVIWETRRVYQSFDELADDLRKRTGRSILHELSDGELEQLVQSVKTHMPENGFIEEKDRWTIWTGEV